VLLPLAENAMKHGPAAGPRGEVRLSVAIAGSRLCVRIDNPGPFRGRRDGGEGIAMAAKRIELAYAGRATFSVRGAGDRTVAEVTLPLDALEPEVSA
jgi:LytS/YehU family sensor histidine kinase